MSTQDRRPHIACVEDADDFDNPIQETARYAASVYTSSVVSPTKEKPNTSRARREKRRDSVSPLTDSDSTVHPQADLVKRTKSILNNKKAIIPTPALRPPIKQIRTTPTMHKREIEASYYGVSPTVTTAASSRPRGTPRPASYYGNSSRPPPANARFYSQQPPVATPTSYPPQSWTPSGQSPFPPPSPVVTHQAQQAQDYFSSRPLEDRFSSGRPQSSIGFRSTRNASYGDYEDDHVHEKSLARRPSVTQRRVSRTEDDRRAMPPPPRRPASARPISLAIRPPPPPSTPGPGRRGAVFDEEDFRGENSLFQDISPHQRFEYGTSIPRSKSRRPSTPIYDVGDFRTEVAGRPARRESYYGNKSASSGSGYEDQVRQATAYQEETGGPAMQLTAETLRKAGRRTGGSSRSTRSSESRDESDFRQSATTRTTRSSNDEDVTIFVKGGTATLKVGGAEMKCKDGTEINIASRNIPTSFRNVSDRSSNYLEDDRRPRIGPPTRTRTSSQSGSYPRSYDPPLGSLGYSPYYQNIPPYPAYPGQEGFF